MVSYRDLAERMEERDEEVDPATIMRSVHRCRFANYLGSSAHLVILSSASVRGEEGGSWRLLMAQGTLLPDHRDRMTTSVHRREQRESGFDISDELAVESRV
jgi:hypothetical protein